MADGGNLYLLVNPSGGKLWRWAYRFEGRQKLMTFGKYPDVSLARVRERHAKQRAILADGVDPMAQKKALKTATRDATENSFGAVAALWVEHWQQGKSRRHVDSIRWHLAADVLPRLGSRPIHEIEVPELVCGAWMARPTASFAGGSWLLVRQARLLLYWQTSTDQRWADKRHDRPG